MDNNENSVTEEQRPSLVDRGIYVTAFCCTRMLEEKDGVFSAIRLSDIITVTIPAARPNQITIAPPIETELAVVFKTEKPESFSANVLLVKPSGERGPSSEYDISTGGSVHGHMLKVHVTLNPREDGDYWFEVSVDGELATRVPLRIALITAGITHPSAQQTQQSKIAFLVDKWLWVGLVSLYSPLNRKLWTLLNQRQGIWN